MADPIENPQPVVAGFGCQAFKIDNPAVEEVPPATNEEESKDNGGN